MSVSAILKSSVYCFSTFPQQRGILWAESDRKREKKSISLLPVRAAGQDELPEVYVEISYLILCFYFLLTFIKYEGILYWIFPAHLCQVQDRRSEIILLVFPSYLEWKYSMRRPPKYQIVVVCILCPFLTKT